VVKVDEIKTIKEKKKGKKQSMQMGKTR